MLSFLKQAVRAVGTLFYPPHCVNCSIALENEESLCEECQKSMEPISAPFCEVCSQPFEGMFPSEFTCSNCEERDLSFSCSVSAYRSKGIVRELVHRFKYNRETHLRRQLAAWLAESLLDVRIQSEPFELLVPVPLHPTRQRKRQFNQAEVLARSVAKRHGLPVLNALRRIRKTESQTRLDRRERMENLRNAFELRKNVDVSGRHLVLVDDVFTTGSTIGECARVLKGAGASSVRAITVARG